MRLLLLSMGLGAVPGFVADARPRGGQVRVAFVPTAGDTYDDPSWVRADRQALLGFGYEVVDLDLAMATPADVDVALDGADLLYVAGGNTFHLLHHVRRSGLDAALARAGSGLRYAGASAGAVIAGPDIAPIAAMDDPAAAPQLAATRGLGLVDVVPIPHVGGPLLSDDVWQAIRTEHGDRFRLAPLGDDQALLVSEQGDVTTVASAR